MANNLHTQKIKKKRKKDRKASIGNEEENRDEMLFCVLPAGRLSLCVDHTIYIRFTVAKSSISFYGQVHEPHIFEST